MESTLLRWRPRLERAGQRRRHYRAGRVICRAVHAAADRRSCITRTCDPRQLTSAPGAMLVVSRTWTVDETTDHGSDGTRRSGPRHARRPERAARSGRVEIGRAPPYGSSTSRPAMSSRSRCRRTKAAWSGGRLRRMARRCRRISESGGEAKHRRRRNLRLRVRRLPAGGTCGSKCGLRPASGRRRDTSS
jgi:hypothetical protein